MAEFNNGVWKNKSVLITGGTGTFGRHLLHHLLQPETGASKVIIYSRDEMKQYETALEYGDHLNAHKLQFIIGDVRDERRLLHALKGVDIVIHAAALKQVPLGEYYPEEFIKTNILGTENVISASKHSGVERVIALSTSKSVAPLNLYGATKLCADKLMISSNYPHAINKDGGGDFCRFAVIRFGNIFGSRGSVVPLFRMKKATGILPVTDPDMTRFSITVSSMIQSVTMALGAMKGGEIFIPKCASYRIGDLVQAIDEQCQMKIIGLRAGEKMHEEIIAPEEARYTYDLGLYYLILPPWYGIISADKVASDFAYVSNTNPDFLTVADLRQLLSETV